MAETEEGFGAIERLVRDQYEPRVELLKPGRLYEGLKIPGLQETLDVLGGANPTQEQVRGVLKMKKPFFVIEPGQPFTRFVDVINSNRRHEQTDTRVSPYVLERFAQMPVGGVRLGFVEGQTELEEHPNLVRKVLKDQEKLVKADLPNGFEIVNPRTYALVQLDGMKDANTVVDRKSWSQLEDNSNDRTRLIAGGWGFGRVVFDDFDPDQEYTGNRWRSAWMISAQ